MNLKTSWSLSCSCKRQTIDILYLLAGTTTIYTACRCCLVSVSVSLLSSLSALRSFEIWMTFYWNNSHMSQRSQSIIQANQSVGGSVLPLPVSTRRRHCRFELDLRVGRGPNAFQFCMLHVAGEMQKTSIGKWNPITLKWRWPYHGIWWLMLFESSPIILGFLHPFSEDFVNHF